MMTLERTSYWTASLPCKAHLAQWCRACYPTQDSMSVFIVPNRLVYHRTLLCAGLTQGRRMVEERGGCPSAIDEVRLDTARWLIRFPCLVCRPAP